MYVSYNGLFFTDFESSAVHSTSRYLEGWFSQEIIFNSGNDNHEEFVHFLHTHTHTLSIEAQTTDTQWDFLKYPKYFGRMGRPAE